MCRAGDTGDDDDDDDIDDSDDDDRASLTCWGAVTMCRAGDTGETENLELARPDDVNPCFA